MTHIASVSSASIGVTASEQKPPLELDPPSLASPSGVQLGPRSSGNAFALDFIRTMMEKQDVSQMQNHLQLSYSAQMRASLKEAQEELCKKVQENAQAYASSSFWSYLGKIARYVIHVVTIALGVGTLLTGAGAPVGCALIVSGFLGVSTEVMADIGGWEWIAKQATCDIEAQKKIQQVLPVVAQIMSALLSCFSSAIAIWWAGASQAMRTLFAWGVISTILESVLQIGKASADFRIEKKKLEMDAIEDDTVPIEHQLDFIQQKLTASLQAQEKETRASVALIRSATETMRF